MNLADIPKTSLLDVLIMAIDRLEAEGYSCWLLEEFAVKNLCICLDDIPTELPLLPGEIELLASVHDELMMLSEWDNLLLPETPRFAP